MVQPQPGQGNDWTVETLRQHIIDLMAAADQRYQDRFDAQAAAIAAALDAANRVADRLGTTYALREDVARLGGQMAALADLTEAKFVTFRVLVDSQAEKVALALNASDKAVTKAEVSTEKRFEGVNEFRSQLNDQARTFMPRAEAEARDGQNAEKIADLQTRLAELDKRVAGGVSRDAGHQDSRTNLIAIITTVVALVSVAVAIIVATR